MPELPEVETIARGLSVLANRRIARVTLGPHDWLRTPPPSPAAHLQGRRIRAVTRHGKRLHITLDSGAELAVHLGMSGQVTLAPGSAPVSPHTHVRIAFAGWDRELRIRDPRRFGGAWLLGNPDAPGVRPPGALGPDALGIGLREFRGVLARDRQIKALLLDQKAIAGIGNIYCDEALFAARVHPRERAGSLSAEAVRKLHRALRRVLLAAIRQGGSTFRDYRNAMGGAGSFQVQHRVYGREGLPCPRCGTAIARFLAGGRSTHACRRCQRPPRPRRRAPG